MIWDFISHRLRSLSPCPLVLCFYFLAFFCFYFDSDSSCGIVLVLLHHHCRLSSRSLVTEIRVADFFSVFSWSLWGNHGDRMGELWTALQWSPWPSVHCRATGASLSWSLAGKPCSIPLWGTEQLDSLVSSFPFRWVQRPVSALSKCTWDIFPSKRGTVPERNVVFWEPLAQIRTEL